MLVKRYSPEQIAGVLARTYPDRPEMQVSHETIYKALYVQGRGELRRELTKCLRTGRALRKPRNRPRAGQGRGRIPGMVNISQRPAEAADRAVPGHWEGDLILGKNQRSPIGTLVERSTGFVQLLHLPARRDPETVAEAMIATIKTLPEALRRSLTWDQGKEMSAHARISIDADIDIYFCDPHSPWQLTVATRQQTRTPTVFCVNTSRKAPTYPCTPPTTLPKSPPNSTNNHANASAGTVPPKSSPSYCQTRQNPLLQPNLETAIRITTVDALSMKAARISYSHSMVPGGLLVMSSTTRLTSATSLVMRVEMRSSTS